MARAPEHRIVLVGGGHTHVQVMRALADRPEPGVRLTLVTDRRLTPYSGMLPGHVAWVYRFDEMHIDLARLAAATGTELVEASATGLDTKRRLLLTNGGEPLPYDTLSLNVGITPDLQRVAGAERHGLAVKPIAGFLGRLAAALPDAGPAGPPRLAVIGGGAAGIELAFALRARLAGGDIALLSAGEVGATLNASVRRRVRSALARHAVALHEGFRAVEVSEAGVRAQDGRFVTADACLISTAARAPAWLAGTGLAVDADGAVLTERTLAAVSDGSIFAVGDCATVADDPRPRAGVFAVRQGPALERNLRRRARGEALLPHHAQRDYLTILMTGDGSAIAGRGRWLALEGRLVWRWKDWIDRRFMRRFQL